MLGGDRCTARHCSALGVDQLVNRLVFEAASRKERESCGRWAWATRRDWVSCGRWMGTGDELGRRRYLRVPDACGEGWRVGGIAGVGRSDVA